MDALVVFDDADNEEKEESPDIMEFAPFIFNECPPEGSLLLIMVFIIGWGAIGVGFDVVGCSDRLNLYGFILHTECCKFIVVVRGCA